MSNEDSVYSVDARIDTPTEFEDPFKDSDPFVKSWEDLKAYSDLDQNFKRRTSRIAKTLSMPTTDAYLDSANANATGIGGAESQEINPGDVFRNGYGMFDVITPPWNLYELANYYDTSFANHSAIDAKVQNIVGLGYDFHVSSKTTLRLEENTDKEKAKKANRKIERTRLELRDWVDTLNSEESLSQTLSKFYTDVQSTGNGYLEIGRTTAGKIGYVGHIPSTTMRVRRLRDGYVQIIGNKVVYFRNFGAQNQSPMTTDKRPNEILHYKKYSPLNTFYGVPDIMSAISALHGDQLASQFNIDYFANKAVPRYIITLKGAKLSPASEEKMFRFLQTSLKGQSHRTLYIPLPGDSADNKVELEMKPIENGIQEASFKEYRLHNRQEILIAHKVPLSKVGGGDTSSIADALAQDRTFKEQMARPEQKNLEKMINKIIAERTDIVEFKFNELTLTDEISESQIVERYVKHQVMTPNEARERIGLPQRPGGDEVFEMSPRMATDSRANTARNRERDSERSNNQSDGPGTVSGRNAAGEGNSSK